MQCPTPLGMGVKTNRRYCDVLTGRDPAAGVIIMLPPHKGNVTLTLRANEHVMPLAVPLGHILVADLLP